MLRTHTCAEPSEKDLKKEVILCGWVDSRRDHGKIIFIDLRDRYGLTQIVFLPKPNVEVYNQAKKIRNEDVLRIKGTINQRPKGTENPKIATGLVEIEVKEIEILNPADDLPFTLEEDSDVGEDVRLTYRYLDLRRKSVFSKIFLRHKCNQAFRSFLDKEGFLEVETPYLAKSTPEGARDFLVPSRLQANKFYALPQSPQLFKQILMVSGIDKYYQIVRCFRDEDLRKDRQPEFTQLDLELSFIEEEDLFSLIEAMFAFAVKEAVGKKIKTPFPRISYQDAMKKHKSDKPDLGEGDFRFLWVVDFPLFEYNEEEKRFVACHHPFTSPRKEDIQFLDKDLAKVRARSYDLILNGEEIGSGSIRIHSQGLQKKIFEILGISGEEAEQKFGFLLRAFKYGAPPHGGIAFGLDRLYAIISKSGSIRDTIAFPKTQRGICPLTGAPSNVSEKQLREIYIELIKEKEES